MVQLSSTHDSLRISARRARRRRGSRLGAGAGGGGWTLVEVITVVAITAIVTGVVLTIVSRTRKAAAQTGCLSNLRHIGSALTQYAADNNDRFPDPYNSETSWEFSVRRYVTSPSQTFRCSADAEVFPMLGSSYDWRDTGKPETTLAGRSLVEVRRQDAVLAFEALPGWHEKTKMNAARVDGSVQVMDREQCLGDLMTPIR